MTIPNTRLRLSLPAVSASFGPQYRILARVAPSGREHGPQYTVTIVEIVSTDIHGTYVHGPATQAEVERNLEKAGRSWSDVVERLIDKHVAATEPKARKSGKAAA
jgi:hypothetical protein